MPAFNASPERQGVVGDAAKFGAITVWALLDVVAEGGALIPAAEGVHNAGVWPYCW